MDRTATRVPAALAVLVAIAVGGRAAAQVPPEPTSTPTATPTATPTSTPAATPPRPVSPWFVVAGAKYGRIERWGGSIGMAYDLGREADRRTGVLTGPLAAFEMTQGTLAGHLGYGWFATPYLGLSIRGAFLRGWNAPRLIEVGDRYVGVETKVMFLGFNAFVAGYRRAGSGRGPGWVADTGVGIGF